MSNTSPVTHLKKSQNWRTFERVAIFVFGFLVLFHCLTVLGFISRYGRLSMAPIYDDVSYLIDGLHRLDAFDNHGFRGLLKSFFNDPPHAPYSSLLATLGFALTPRSMVGAYALGAVWVVIFLILLQQLLRELPRLTQIGVLISSLAVPMLALLLGSFRPDASWGLITGAVAIIIATANLGQATRSKMLLYGLLIGAALLSKPTGMPAGSVVVAIGYFAAMAVTLIGGTASPKQMMIKTGFMLTGLILIVGPYLVVGGRDLLQYILDVMVKNSAVWRTEGSLKVQLTYYLVPDLLYGMTGWLMLAGPLFLLAGLGITGLSGNKVAFARSAGVCTTLLVAYIIPAISPVKSAFIGSLFYGTFIASAFWCLAQILKAVRPASEATALIAGALVFAGFWRPGPAIISTKDEFYTAIGKANQEIIPPVVQFVIAAATSDNRTLNIYAPSPGPIFDATLQYATLLQGISVNAVGDYLNSDWSSILDKAQNADIVITSDAGALGQGGGFSFPSIQYQSRLIQTLSADSAWRKLTTYVDSSGYRTVVFTKYNPPKTVISFGSGFRQEEGPFPAMHLPRFHWMTAETATLIVRSKDTSTLKKGFGLQCESPADVTVSVMNGNGETLATKDIRSRIATGQFDTIDIPLDNETTGWDNSISLTLKASTMPAGADWPGPVLCATAPIERTPP